MSNSKTFGVRIPLDQYIKMVKVCATHKLTQTDLIIIALNEAGVFLDNFDSSKLFGGSAGVDAEETPKTDYQKKYEELKKKYNDLLEINKSNISQYNEVLNENKELNKLVETLNICNQNDNERWAKDVERLVQAYGLKEYGQAHRIYAEIKERNSRAFGIK